MNQYHVEYSSTTKSLQALHDAISETVASQSLTDDDILTLRYWMDDNIHLSGNYPFTKIYSIVDDILADGVIEPEERENLLFILSNEMLCDPAPFTVTSLTCSHVCLTGTFSFAQRKDIEKILMRYGAFLDSSVARHTHYLFVGGFGSRSWAYGNYGNKVKKAKELQECGGRVQIFAEDVLLNFLETHTPPQFYTFEECLDLLDGLPDNILELVLQYVNSVMDAGKIEVVSRSDRLQRQLLVEKNIVCNCDDSITGRTATKLNTGFLNPSLLKRLKDYLSPKLYPHNEYYW